MPPVASQGDSACTLAAVAEQTGDTPLVRLDRMHDRDDITVWAKLESRNPGGSAKDRTALAMINDAVATGRLRPGGTVVESSSGNLGVAVARVCRLLGLDFHCVTDSKANPLTTRQIRAFGATLHVVDQPDPTTGDLLTARLDRVRELCADLPDALWLNQYANPAVIAAHAEGTMHEIACALDHRVDHLFVAVSTTGTLRGCQRYLHEHDMTTQLIAVDALGSVLFGGDRQARTLTGFGAGTVPDLAHEANPDLVIRVSEPDTIAGCRLVAATEGHLVGASSGAVTHAFHSMLADFKPGARVALIFADGGVPYLDTVFDDDWVEQNIGLGADELAALADRYPHR